MCSAAAAPGQEQAPQGRARLQARLRGTVIYSFTLYSACALPLPFHDDLEVHFESLPFLFVATFSIAKPQLVYTPRNDDDPVGCCMRAAIDPKPTGRDWPFVCYIQHCMRTRQFLLVEFTWLWNHSRLVRACTSFDFRIRIAQHITTVECAIQF